MLRLALLVARAIVNCRTLNTCGFDAGQPWWGIARDSESHCVALLRQPYGFRLQKRLAVLNILLSKLFMHR
jgi:hypothetical protein